MGCTITIQYKPSVKFSEEVITITIEDTTFGALSVLANELKKLQKPENPNEGFTQIAYRDLLQQLITELQKKLNEDL
jgi:hypothetical protein